jgi:hypothetical protein
VNAYRGVDPVRRHCAPVDRSRASICRSGRTGASTAASQRSHGSDGHRSKVERHLL